MTKIRSMIIQATKSNICGVEFTSGEDMCVVVDEEIVKRCGSVIVSVIDGQSYYGRVVKFFKSACNKQSGSFAYVDWLGKPDYPFDNTPLIVRVRDNASVCPSPNVISILDIDPTKIIFERDEREGCFYMLRLKGLNTIK